MKNHRSAIINDRPLMTDDEHPCMEALLRRAIVELALSQPDPHEWLARFGADMVAAIKRSRIN